MIILFVCVCVCVCVSEFMLKFIWVEKTLCGIELSANFRAPRNFHHSNKSSLSFDTNSGMYANAI